MKAVSLDFMNSAKKNTNGCLMHEAPSTIISSWVFHWTYLRKSLAKTGRKSSERYWVCRLKSKKPWKSKTKSQAWRKKKRKRTFTSRLMSSSEGLISSLMKGASTDPSLHSANSSKTSLCCSRSKTLTISLLALNMTISRLDQTFTKVKPHWNITIDSTSTDCTIWTIPSQKFLSIKKMEEIWCLYWPNQARFWLQGLKNDTIMEKKSLCRQESIEFRV